MAVSDWNHVSMPIWFRVLGGVYLIAIVNSLFQFIAFADWRKDDAAAGLLQVIPFMLFTHALVAWDGRKRLAWALGLLPALACALFIGLLSVLRVTFPGGVERVQSVPLGFTTVNAYQTDGGATTSYGMIVRQELNILPGVVLVRRLAYEYPADRVVIERPAPRTVRFTFPAYGDRRPEATVVERTLLLR